MAACLCVPTPARKTESSTVTGAWWRVGARRTVGCCSVKVLYLGEINDSQKAAWTRAIEVFAEAGPARQVAIFPDDRPAPELDCEVVHIRLSELSWHRARQWGACWLALELWDQLDLDEFWSPHLPPSRQGTRWLNVVKTLVVYRLIDPGSEWRVHRHWYRLLPAGHLETSAQGTGPGNDPARRPGEARADPDNRCAGAGHRSIAVSVPTEAQAARSTAAAYPVTTGLGSLTNKLACRVALLIPDLRLLTSYARPYP